VPGDGCVVFVGEGRHVDLHRWSTGNKNSAVTLSASLIDMLNNQQQRSAYRRTTCKKIKQGHAQRIAGQYAE
jgi:hypothetical protein